MKETLIAVMSDLKDRFVEEVAGARAVWDIEVREPEYDLMYEKKLESHSDALLDQCRSSKNQIKMGFASILEGSDIVIEKVDDKIVTAFLKGAFDSEYDLIERIERFASLFTSRKPDEIQHPGTLPGQKSPEYDNLVSELDAYIANAEEATD